ncbi:GerAB/ArcD/ProY family transporter [Cohnella candidum]|uniref:Spore gernimation protein n=1 Tax=Cohnella candidum TaxID=2674991 RepID=A0A3G3JVN1_9BACL|nr:GerAB/ArcD/ProY family transporter [Cohnella candidum]AYQ72286.1 spore gernimation protein [Cohnella candidum]
MGKPSVRASELAILLILFEIGSTTLFLQAPKAKQDAWLSMFLAAAGGLLLLALYLVIHKRDPDRDLFDLCKRYLGKYLGTLLGCVFACYFLYEASRNLRDLGELTVLTLLDRTPIAFIMFIALLVIANSARYGLRGIALTCVALFPTLMVSYLILIVLIWNSGLIHVEFMFPLLENGIVPVAREAFPALVSFPFGQTVLFLVFFAYAKKDGAKEGKGLPKAIVRAYIFVALFLIAINQINILVLGPVLAANCTFPLLESVQLIHFNRPLRMDPLFTIVLFVGLGIKAVCFLAAAAMGGEKLIGFGFKKWIVVLGAVIYPLAFVSPNLSHHLWLGRVITVKFVSPIFQIALPMLLFAVMLLRRKLKPA